MFTIFDPGQSSDPHLSPEKICSAIPSLSDQRKVVEAIASNGSSPWQERAQETLRQLAPPYTTVDDFLDTLNWVQRFRMISAAGLETNQTFAEEFAVLDAPTWASYTPPPAAEELQRQLADQLYNGTPGKTAVLRVGSTATLVTHYLLERLLTEQINFELSFVDVNFLNLAMIHSDAEGVRALAGIEADPYQQPCTRIVCREVTPEEEIIEVDSAKTDEYEVGIAPMIDRLCAGEVDYRLTEIPTTRDAAIEGMSYEELVEYYFRMCDQPWPEISAAHDYLIAKLNRARKVQFLNSDGTDLSMSIEGFTFVSSLSGTNIPGSEVFSAPARESVNGTLVAPGKIASPNSASGVIEDIRLEFIDGKIVDADASASTRDDLYSFLNRDPGHRYVGELGLGTNPFIDRVFVNDLYREKTRLSFHLALGNCFTFTEYNGAPVHLDNGNRASGHWDIAVLLGGKNGTMTLDDDAIVYQGTYTIPQLKVLELGWATIPVAARPDHWKTYGE